MLADIKEAIEIGHCPATRKKARKAMKQLASIMKKLTTALNGYQELVDRYEFGLQYLENTFEDESDE